jgi:ammonia channel protein AmtB
LALALVAAAVAGRSRLLLTVLFAAASSYLSYRHMETWTYYTVVTGLLLLTLAAAWPGARATSPDTDHEVGDGAAPMRPTTAVPD